MRQNPGHLQPTSSESQPWLFHLDWAALAQSPGLGVKTLPFTWREYPARPCPQQTQRWEPLRPQGPEVRSRGGEKGGSHSGVETGWYSLLSLKELSHSFGLGKSALKCRSWWRAQGFSATPLPRKPLQFFLCAQGGTSNTPATRALQLLGKDLITPASSEQSCSSVSQFCSADLLAVLAQMSPPVGNLASSA